MTRENEANVPRVRWWWAAAMLPLVLLLFVLVIVFLPHIVTGERLRMEAVSALTELLGAPVQIGRIEYDPFSGIEIEKFIIGPPDGFTENVLTVDRAIVQYQLGGIWGRRIIVDEICVVGPILTLETRGGRKNLDVILANVSRGGEKEQEQKKEDKEQEQEEASRGGLLPIDIDLTALEIGPVTLRLIGEGVSARLEKARLSIDGHAGRQRLDVKLAVIVHPEEAENIALSMPANHASGRALEVRARFDFEMKIEIEAATAQGLALKRAAVHVSSENRLSARWGEEEVDPAVVSTAVGLSIEPGMDRARVERAEILLDGAPMMVAHGELDGISALVGAVAGEALVALLGASVGLVDKRRTGTVEVAIDRMLLPLDRFERWLQMFVPGLEIGGRVTLEPFFAAGDAREMGLGTPSKLHLALKLDGVRANLPSAELAIDDLGGWIEGVRKEGRYAFTGALQVGRVAQGRNRIETTGISLEAVADRLSYPHHGRMEAKIDVALAGIALPPAWVKRADVHASLVGLDPLAPERVSDPIQLSAKVEVPSARIQRDSSTESIDLGGVKLAVDAAIDRLGAPANDPIAAKVALSLDRASLGGGPLLSRASLELEAQAGDPRKGAFDVDARLAAKLGSMMASSARVEDAKVTASMAAKDVRAREIVGFPGATPPMMPAGVALKLGVRAPNVTVSDRDLGDVATPLSVDLSLSADPVAATASLEKLSVELQDALTLRLKGRAARLYSVEPWIDGEVDVGPVHLDKLAAKLPKNLLKPFPDLVAEGKLELSARAKGTIPRQFSKTALVNQPVEGHARLLLDGVGISSKKGSLALSNLNGAIIGEIGGGKVETRTELDAAQILYGRPPLANDIQKLTVQNQVRLKDEVWTVASHVLAASVRSAFGGKGAVEGASIDIDLTYPQRGDLDLTRFDIHAPGNGVELGVSGRLKRRAFGVFRPDLSVRANLDLDRLRHLLPELAGGRGMAAFALKVATRSDRLVDVEGSVETKNFSWDIPHQLKVLNASGRLPVSQRFLLPAPELDVKIASSIGALGDDFEARADELYHDFERGRGLFSIEDILVEAPRSADYQTLRPYYASSGARLTIDGIVYRQHAIEDVVLEGMWSSGVLRIDRFACRLWEGDVLGDLALQLTPDRNIRVRMRGTITDLNIDLPYAIIKGVEPVKDPKDKEDYRVSGQMDLSANSKQRSLNARIDLTKLELPLVRRVFATMNLPERAQSALEMAQLVGVRPTSGKIWIANNLLNVNFDWERLWLHASLDQEKLLEKALDVVLVPFRFLLIPTLGGYVINTVNESIRDFSISAVLDDVLGQLRVEDQLRFLEGRIIAADRADGLPNPVSLDMLSPP